MRSIFGVTENIRCYDVATIEMVAGVVLAPFTGGASLALTGMGAAQKFGSKGKGGDAGMPAQAEAPDPNKAAQTALDAQNVQRRTLLATGGKTDQTGGSAMLLGSDISTLNLGGM